MLLSLEDPVPAFAQAPSPRDPVNRITGTALLAAAMLPAAVNAQGQGVDRAGDLAAFESGYLNYDNSFSPDGRAEARRRFAALETCANRLSDAEFEMAIAEIAALSDNGHSQLLPARWVNDFAQIGIRFLITDDGLHVADAIDAHRDLIGRRVAFVEGQDLPALREIWDRYANGSQGYRDQSLPLFLETPAMVHAAGIGTAPEGVRLTFSDGDETVISAREQPWPEVGGIFYYLPESRMIDLARAGRVAGEPLYLQEPDSFSRLVSLPEHDAVYIQFRGNVDFSRQSDMTETSEAMIEQLRRISPRHVIVDQRFNLGGDLNTTRRLMQAIPEIIGELGNVYAITSGRSFSAAIVSLAFLKAANAGQLTIVGSPIGDRLEFWAEGDEAVELRSGALIARSTERHDYIAGCPEPDCHAGAAVHDLRVDDLDPDYRPVFTYEDFVSGRDPYLEAVFALMNAGGSPDGVPGARWHQAASESPVGPPLR